MSTRYARRPPCAAGELRTWPRAGPRASSPAEEVALVASARRALLLRVHAHRLRREDLEDCFGQAVLELIAHVEAGGRYEGRAHAANALELRFLSRVRDRRRALGGRSPLHAALERADGVCGRGVEHEEIADRSPGVDAQVIVREELRRLGEAAALLSADQRLVLRSQVGGVSCAEFCSEAGWSREKYRKTAQRARARLRTLVDPESGVPFAAQSSE